MRTALPLLEDTRAMGGPVFTLGTGTDAFNVNVAPSCAGANSVLGFLLVGGAALCVLRGRRRTKLAWLASGVVLMVGLNLLRLVLLFWVGSRYGQTAAMTWLHPFAGLVLFALGVTVLLALLPRFGIAVPDSGGTALRAHPPRGWQPLTRTGTAAVIAPALLLGMLNGDLGRYAPFAGVSESALAIPVTGESAVAVSGWVGARYDEVTWAKPYFGAESTWIRYGYTRPDGRGPGSGEPLYVDVVSTPRLRAFSQFGLEACYRFHGYRISHSNRVDVGAPAAAQAITYVDSATNRHWVALSWVSPVRAPVGKRFERIVLLVSATSPSLEAARRDLVSFARTLIRRQDSDGRRRAA